MCSASRPEFGDEFLDAATDFVADGAYNIEALPGWIVDLPVEVALAREDGADVAAAHGDDDIAGLDGVSGEGLGFLVGEVDAFFAHGFDDDRVDGVGRGRSGGADFDGVVGEVGEVAGGHLGAAGVVDADEQDAWLVGHGVPFWWLSWALQYLFPLQLQIVDILDGCAAGLGRRRMIKNGDCHNGDQKS